MKRVSFAACGKAKDVQLATTRFRAAVLPQDKELETALFHRLNAACGKAKDVQLATTRFRAAVLPQDKELETALFHRLNAKKCAAAGRRDIQFL